MKKGKLLAVGKTGCAGLVSGVVRLVDHDPELSMILKPGEILVAAYTSPDHIPAMGRSAGIITESGGRMSHAAIVAREMNKPALVGVSGILDPEKGLKNGQRIIIEANLPLAGEVIGKGAIYEDIDPTAPQALPETAKGSTLAAEKGISLAQAFLEKRKKMGLGG